MASTKDVVTAETTVHADLVAENGLIKQLLVMAANGNLDPVTAQSLVDTMNSDDADAKTNLAAIQAVLTPATGTGATQAPTGS